MTGSGTELDPYIISTADDLDLVNDDLTAWYELANDITANGTFLAIGTDANAFEGHFDGKDYKITIPSWDYEGSFVGLFAQISIGATIDNLIVNIDSLTGYYYAGGLVGKNAGIITKCGTEGTSVKATNRVGGLVGWNTGTILKSYSMVADVARLGNSSTASYSGIGGLVGHNEGIITDCYARSNIDGRRALGGLAGYNGGTVDNCYSTGEIVWDTVLGNHYPDWHGGLIGRDGGGTVTDSFWDTETSGEPTSAGGTGKTTTQMNTTSTFTSAGWNFSSIWARDDVTNDKYPYFHFTDILPHPFSQGQIIG